MAEQPFRMEFSKAREFVLGFGQFEDQTLDQIGQTDRGLLYLDWLRGFGRLSIMQRAAVEGYLSDPTVAQDLTNIVKDRRRW